jgi:hypothetical protein
VIENEKKCDGEDTQDRRRTSPLDGAMDVSTDEATNKDSAMDLSAKQKFPRKMTMDVSTDGASKERFRRRWK